MGFLRRLDWQLAQLCAEGRRAQLVDADTRTCGDNAARAGHDVDPVVPEVPGVLGEQLRAHPFQPG